MRSNLVLIAALTCVTLYGAEKKVKRADLPPAVQTAVDSVSKGATVVGFAKEVENGKTLYEVEMKENGVGKDVTLDENGKTVSIEQETQFDSLPDAVKTGLTKAAGNGKISKVETVTEGGVVKYEAALKGGRYKEITVDTSGKLVAHE
jgi:uncharacterized membrane protein YkoI